MATKIILTIDIIVMLIHLFMAEMDMNKGNNDKATNNMLIAIMFGQICLMVQISSLGGWIKRKVNYEH